MGLQNSFRIRTNTVPVYPRKSVVTIKNPTFPRILKQAMNRSKKDSLESQIGNIQAQALDKQPCHRRQTEPVLPERNDRHCNHSHDDKTEQDG